MIASPQRQEISKILAWVVREPYNAVQKSNIVHTLRIQTSSDRVGLMVETSHPQVIGLQGIYIFGSLGYIIG